MRSLSLSSTKNKGLGRNLKEFERSQGDLPQNRQTLHNYYKRLQGLFLHEFVFHLLVFYKGKTIQNVAESTIFWI